VKRDLEQFNIPYDFNYLKSKSKDAFKRIVKNKAKEVALEVLKAKQQKHTKMENLKFLELKRQTYFNLQHFRVEAKTLTEIRKVRDKLWKTENG
jgi:hypothetical protein